MDKAITGLQMAAAKLEKYGLVVIQLLVAQHGLHIFHAACGCRHPRSQRAPASVA